jgi:hypothetical protein|tara:strand:+ start:10347 stop:10547 length:201 start_codon:yes stop_codon:yes gene_type:complete
MPYASTETTTNMEVIRNSLYNAEQEVNELQRLLKIAYRRLEFERTRSGYSPNFQTKLINWVWSFFY